MRKRQLSDDAMGDPFYPMPILTVPFFQGLGFMISGSFAPQAGLATFQEVLWG